MRRDFRATRRFAAAPPTVCAAVSGLAEKTISCDIYRAVPDPTVGRHVRRNRSGLQSGYELDVGNQLGGSSRRQSSDASADPSAWSQFERVNAAVRRFAEERDLVFSGRRSSVD
jgi:hypothetical protein